MLRARKKIVSTLFLTLWFLCPVVYAHNWQPLISGMEYLDLNDHSISQWSHLHAFRIDLKQLKLSVIMAKDFNQPHASAAAFHHYGQALIAINGGFFSPNQAPLGLRMTDQHLLNPLRQISWWGVFFVKNQQAFVTAPYDFNIKQNIEFAVQSGPRLLIKGRIPALRPGYANRSALGIDKAGKVIIIVTENLPLSTSDLAHIIKKAPFNCYDALNLDGGRSSQLYAKIGNFELTVPGFSQVSDAIIVKQRS